MIAERLNIEPEEHRGKSILIQRKLISMPIFDRSRRVATYASFRGEVETWLIFEEGLRLGKEMLLPIAGEEGLDFALAMSREELRPGRYGILVPPQEPDRIKPLEEIDLILVPAVAFDLEGYRLGYGGGYYDQALIKVRGKKVGLAFDLQILERLPRGPSDAKVDMIITETRIIEVPSGAGRFES